MKLASHPLSSIDLPLWEASNRNKLRQAEADDKERIWLLKAIIDVLNASLLLEGGNITDLTNPDVDCPEDGNRGIQFLENLMRQNKGFVQDEYFYLYARAGIFEPCPPEQEKIPQRVKEIRLSLAKAWRRRDTVNLQREISRWGLIYSGHLDSIAQQSQRCWSFSRHDDNHVAEARKETREKYEGIYRRYVKKLASLGNWEAAYHLYCLYESEKRQRLACETYKNLFLKLLREAADAGDFDASYIFYQWALGFASPQKYFPISKGLLRPKVYEGFSTDGRKPRDLELGNIYLNRCLEQARNNGLAFRPWKQMLELLLDAVESQLDYDLISAESARNYLYRALEMVKEMSELWGGLWIPVFDSSGQKPLDRFLNLLNRCISTKLIHLDDLFSDGTLEFISGQISNDIILQGKYIHNKTLVNFFGQIESECSKAELKWVDNFYQKCFEPGINEILKLRQSTPIGSANAGYFSNRFEGSHQLDQALQRLARYYQRQSILSGDNAVIGKCRECCRVLYNINRHVSGTHYERYLDIFFSSDDQMFVNEAEETVSSQLFERQRIPDRRRYSEFYERLNTWSPAAFFKDDLQQIQERAAISKIISDVKSVVALAENLIGLFDKLDRLSKLGYAKASFLSYRLRIQLNQWLNDEAQQCLDWVEKTENLIRNNPDYKHSNLLKELLNRERIDLATIKAKFRAHRSELQDFISPESATKYLQRSADSVYAYPEALVTLAELLCNERKEPDLAVSYLRKLLDKDEEGKSIYPYSSFEIAIGSGIALLIDIEKQVIKSAEEQKAAINQEKALADAERKHRQELEDLMAMFSHKFRSPLDAIIYNTTHENQVKLYTEAAQTMRGLLDVFSIISTDPERLRDKIRQDIGGEASLSAVVLKTLDMLMLHLLSPAGAGKIRQHYLAYAEQQGLCPPGMSRKNWREDYYELERRLQTEWEQSFAELLGQPEDWESRQRWIETRFFRLELRGFDHNGIRFTPHGAAVSFLTILLNEVLVNAFKYYSSATQQPVVLEWTERDGWQVLTCRNPSVRGERMAIKGSGKGHTFLSTLARKTGSRFDKPTPQDDFVLEFAIPSDLFIAN